jgi:hypothetical protein
VAPPPNELRVGEIVRFADSGNFYNFPLGGRDIEILFARVLLRNQIPKNSNAEWSQNNIPARRRLNIRRTRDARSDHPSAVLKNQVVGRRKVFVRKNSSTKEELLAGLEDRGCGDEI